MELLLRADQLSPKGSRERVLCLGGGIAQEHFPSYFREFSPLGVSSTDRAPLSTGIMSCPPIRSRPCGYRRAARPLRRGRPNPTDATEWPPRGRPAEPRVRATPATI